MISSKKDSVIGGEFLLFDLKAEKIFTIEDFNSDQRMMAESCTDFLNKEVIPRMDKIDSKDHPEIMPELLTKSGELGLLGLSISEKYGGMNMSFNTSMLIADIVGVTGSFSTAYGAHTGIATLPLKYYGSEEQKEKFLNGLVSGELKGAYCLTEPDSGSDANSGKSKARLSSDKSNFIITGQKMWISNGGFADLFIVFAKIDDDKNLTAFIVEKSRNGITMNPEEDKLGIKGSSTRQIFFNNVEIPIENMLGEREGGFKIALNVLNIGRIKLGAGVLGGCRGVIDNAINYSNERIQFNAPISSFGAIKQKISKMIVQTFSCESICYRAGDDIEKKISLLQQEGKSLNESELEAIELFSVECAISKIYGSEILDFVVDEGLQIYGGMGFSEEAPMARPYRDARISRIYEGTNEINRMLIVGTLLKRSLKKEIKILEKATEVIQSNKFESVSYDENKHFESSYELIDKLKSCLLLILGKSALHFGNKIKTEQEVMMNISDMIISIYVMESTLKRCEKVFNKTNNDILLDISKSSIYYNITSFKNSAVESIISFMDESDCIKNKRIIDISTNFRNFNIKEINRKIADYFIEKKSYKIFNNF
jgi:alkylation response protein AidB-like acyl-CoA dehydrogenase